MKSKIWIIMTLLFSLSLEITAIAKTRPRPTKSPEKIDFKAWTDLKGSAYATGQEIKGMVPKKPTPPASDKLFGDGVVVSSRNNIKISETNWKKLKDYINEQKAEEGRELISENFAEAFKKLDSTLLEKEKEEFTKNIYTVLSASVKRWEELAPLDNKPEPDEKYIVAALINRVLFDYIYDNFNKSERASFTRDVNFLAISFKSKTTENSFLEIFNKLQIAYLNNDFSPIHKVIKSHQKTQIPPHTKIFTDPIKQFNHLSKKSGGVKVKISKEEMEAISEFFDQMNQSPSGEKANLYKKFKESIETITHEQAIEKNKEELHEIAELIKTLSIIISYFAESWRNPKASKKDKETISIFMMLMFVERQVHIEKEYLKALETEILFSENLSLPGKLIDKVTNKLDKAFSEPSINEADKLGKTSFTDPIKQFNHLSEKSGGVKVEISKEEIEAIGEFLDQTAPLASGEKINMYKRFRESIETITHEQALGKNKEELHEMAELIKTLSIVTSYFAESWRNPKASEEDKEVISIFMKMIFVERYVHIEKEYLKALETEILSSKNPNLPGKLIYNIR